MNNTLPTTLKRLGIRRVQEAKGIVEYKLAANGLKILLLENHSAPVVTVMVLYRVGSRNEGLGETGATHFLEHMMFKGTRKFNPHKGNGLDDLLKPVGALYNATTWFDRTNYFEAVPSEHQELCLALEADRMRNLVLKQSDRDSEMTVVRNEFERGENDPDDVMRKDVYAVAFREHPYRIPTIGYRSDVENVPMERLKAFYDRFYWPNNATVIVVGDINQEETLKLVHKHFAKISASPHRLPDMYTVEPPQEGERRFEVSRAGDLPRVVVAFHVPQSTHKDNYALAAASAILGGGRRSSRLYKRLVDAQLASEAWTWHNEQRDPGLLMVGATVAPGAKAEDVEAAIHDELSRLVSEPVSEDDLRRAKSANRKGTVLAAADPLVMARQIGEAEAVADWTWYVHYDDNFDAVSPADVQAVAARYFLKKNRTVGHFIPAEEAEGNGHAPEAEPAAAAEPAKVKKARPRKAAKAKTAKGRKKASARKPTASYADQVKRVVLPNGMTLLVMRNPGTGSVAVSGKLKAGGYFAPADKTLVAGLTAHMLTKGSKGYSKAVIAETLEEMGTGLNFGADNFVVNFASAVVKEDFPAFTAMLADIMRNPLFEDEELARSGKQYAAYIQQQMKDTGATAKAKLVQSLYSPDCVYFDKPFEELIEELKAIDAGDLKAYHRDHYSPKATILTVVGDIDPDKVVADLTAAFGSWQGAESKPIEVNGVGAPTAARRVEVFMADKASVDIVIGLPASLQRKDADFFAARLANAALGQDTLSSRLGLVVREQHGLTYGIYSMFEDVSFGGAPWCIKLTVNPANVEKALALVNEVMSDYVKKGISAAELADEAGRAAGTFQLMLRTSAGIASTLTQFEFLGLPLGRLDSYADDLKQVTKKQVDEAIRKYFRMDLAVTALAGTYKSKS